MSLPFGDSLSCFGTDANTQHFTDKERDAESGNDYFGARYYGSNVAGRFMTPDPSGLYFANPNYPQSLNLYAYVQNNPLTLTDPTGMDCIYSSGSFQPGRCVSDPNNGVYYVDGTITNCTFNPQTGDFGYTFTNYADGSGSSGTGVINFSPPPSLGSQYVTLPNLVLPNSFSQQGPQQGAGTPNTQPNKTNPPKQPKPSKSYTGFVACEIALDMEAISAEESTKPFYFSFVNGAAIMAAQGKIPGPLGIAALAVAGASDISVAANSNQVCTSLMY